MISSHFRGFAGLEAISEGEVSRSRKRHPWVGVLDSETQVKRSQYSSEGKRVRVANATCIDIEQNRKQRNEWDSSTSGIDAVCCWRDEGCFVRNQGWAFGIAWMVGCLEEDKQQYNRGEQWAEDPARA